MGVSGVVLASLLAMGPQWAIIDLPYPEVTAYEAAGAASPQAQVSEAALAWARARDGGKAEAARLHVSQVKIEGPRASAVLHAGERSLALQLEQLKGEWKVVER